ncbi:class I SAM-dependent methyltransferase [Gloeothece verrucosa]|uniref:Cyclopropane-fatty-acyl-phospholipid synthase n=1 Tax=Gloeothece verrucosa (strain PCC 7822) TaxID=497965 RepID=E0ULV5_GLOV7|nr:class I SAM-dependent methyltransferase [Gloeothece verrucosa]ADN17935.1 Cyclopropane-fatty-acyl-phospholipid synthase [Gloeothece verrucosa PCC 7822]
MENVYFLPNTLHFLSKNLQATLQKSFETCLAEADIKINGDRPWDIQVHDPKFYTQIFFLGSLGLGESYLEGWWYCPQLDVLFTKLLRNRVQEKIRTYNFWGQWEILKTAWFNLQTITRSFQVGRHHYNLDKNIYEKMLDSRLTYSCGYWRNATTLEEAQEAKLDLICRKLKLEKGMTLLDVGCGWGSLIKYMEWLNTKIILVM